MEKNDWLDVQGITEMHKNHPWNLHENINSKIWELPSHKSDLFLLSHLQLNIQPQHPGEPRVKCVLVESSLNRRMHLHQTGKWD